MSCKHIIYSILSFLLFILCNTHKVYSQWENNSVVRNELYRMFSDVDKTKVPTQLLLDYAVDLLELSNYDGRTITDSNYISLIDYENILRSIRSASVTTSKPFRNVENIIDSFTTTNDESSIKMSLALYKYNRIKANALEDGLIGYDATTGKVFDKYDGDTWINPYEEVNVVAFALNRGVVNFRTTLSLELTSAFMFSNNTENIRHILLNAGDGRGWRKITANTPINIHYSSVGEKEVIIRIVTNNQGELVAHSKLLVQSPAPNNAPASTIPFTEYTPQSIDTIYNGTTVSATLLLSAINGNTIKKPFIFVEGFDPGPFIDTVLVEAFFGPIGQYGFSDIGMINYDAWEDVIKAKGYDLIYVNWENSLADIRANAALLEKILNIINQDKHNNGSEEKNILMGHSMGGLISRYALCDMESRNMPHEVTTYVSFDSPHLGANVPLGALYFIPQAINLLYNTNIPHVIDGATWGLLNETKRALYNIMHAQSVKQMLMNYVKSDDTYEVGTPTEQFTVAFRYLALNPNDVGLTAQLKENYLKGNSCYLAYPNFKNYVYWTGTRVALQDMWRFTFFNTSEFLNLLNSALNNASGEERTIFVFPMFICNTEKEQLQSVPFAIIYKPTFADE